MPKKAFLCRSNTDKIEYPVTSLVNSFVVQVRPQIKLLKLIKYQVRIDHPPPTFVNHHNITRSGAPSAIAPQPAPRKGLALAKRPQSVAAAASRNPKYCYGNGMCKSANGTFNHRCFLFWIGYKWFRDRQSCTRSRYRLMFLCCILQDHEPEVGRHTKSTTPITNHPL